MVEKIFRIYTDKYAREEVYREGIKKISAPIKKLITGHDFVYYERPFVKAFKKTPIIYKQALVIPSLSVRISKLYTEGFRPYRGYNFYIDIGKVEKHDGYILFKDLFLDIIEFTDGRKIIEDKDELEEALKKGWITKDEYNHAKTVCQSIWEEVKDIAVEEFVKRYIDTKTKALFTPPIAR